MPLFKEKIRLFTVKNLLVKFEAFNTPKQPGNHEWWAEFTPFAE